MRACALCLVAHSRQHLRTVDHSYTRKLVHTFIHKLVHIHAHNVHSHMVPLQTDLSMPFLNAILADVLAPLQQCYTHTHTHTHTHILAHTHRCRRIHPLSSACSDTHTLYMHTFCHKSKSHTHTYTHTVSLQIDPSLPFLNAIVADALAAGAKVYHKPSADEEDAAGGAFRRGDDGCVCMLVCTCLCVYLFVCVLLACARACVRWCFSVCVHLLRVCVCARMCSRYVCVYVAESTHVRVWKGAVACVDVCVYICVCVCVGFDAVYCVHGKMTCVPVCLARD